MKIHQIYTKNELRNFTYILELEDQTAIVIDPWSADEIVEFLTNKNLSLTSIINTHEHWDHTQGNEALVAQYDCEVWAHANGAGKIPCLTRELNGGELIRLDDNNQLKVLNTPGHTFAHLCFIVIEKGNQVAVFTGDTLFNAGVGNCHGGDAEVMYQTVVDQFQTLADDVLVYPGHDYLENNLRFTLNFEPINQMAKEWLSKVTKSDYQPGDIITNIGNEKSFNTFMRLDNSETIKNLSLNSPSDKEVFLTLRSKRNSW
ncbi:MAG: hydroxyacylglutathione hydrolase [Gammaproteobacteria bacterium]|nr:MAG: hydroxyacylglutathione hydrolase [Gammaproteobacteria bacterium]